MLASDLIPVLRAESRAALAAVDVSRLPDGTPGYLLPRLATFDLTTSALAVDNVRVVASTDPARRWLRRVEYNSEWASQTAWAVDTAAGNDDATGRPGAPLKTIDECVCRTWAAVYPVGTNACTVTLAGNMSATDSGHFNVRGNGSFPLSADSPLGYDTAFQIIGQPVSVGFSGVMSSVQNGALGSLLDIHFTDSGIPVSFTASGFLARDLIFKRTTAPVAYFWPVKDLGSKTLRCSQLNQAFAFGTYPALANANTYQIMTLPHIHDVDFPASNAMFADYQIALCYDTTAAVSAPATCLITRYGYSYANAQQTMGGFFNCQLAGGANLGEPFTNGSGQMVSGCVRAAAGVTNSRLTVGSGAFFEMSEELGGFITLQGCDIVIDVQSRAMRLQAMFFDVSTPLLSVGSNGGANLIKIGGSGNTSKIFSNGPVSSVGYDNVPNAAMTSDANPYRSVGVSFAVPTTTAASLAYQGPN